jgi:transcriptional regulator with XRE-family HTH domain
MARSLKELRDDAYLTQKEVADQLSVTVSTISNWERGVKRPQVRSIRRLAELYKVSPKDIDMAVEQALSAAGNGDAEEE